MVLMLSQLRRQKWHDKSEELFSQCKYASLIEHCKKRITEYPNDVHAYWWLARSYKELGNIEKSKILFEKVIKLEPSWKKEAVDPFLVIDNVEVSPINKDS